MTDSAGCSRRAGVQSGKTREKVLDLQREVQECDYCLAINIVEINCPIRILGWLPGNQLKAARELEGVS